MLSSPTSTGVQGNSSSSDSAPSADENLGSSQPRDSSPTATREVFAVLGEESLAQRRRAFLPDQHGVLSEAESFQKAVEYFHSASLHTAHITDHGLYQKAKLTIATARTTISAVHDFARQYFDPHGTASKAMLLQATLDLVGEVYQKQVELENIIVTYRQSVQAKPIPPEVQLSNECKVLTQSKGDPAATIGEVKPVTLAALPSPSTVAAISQHSYDFEPHDHLLVDALYVISSQGLREELPLPPHSPGAKFDPGLTTVTLQFSGLTRSGALPQIPGFQVRAVFSETRTEENDTLSRMEVTYSDDFFNKQRVHPHTARDRAELCVPEMFSTLIQKLKDCELSSYEKAQLVAQAFAEQKLVYCRDRQIAELLSSCEPRQRISLILGLGIGDCTLLSAALQQLLAHAGIDAVIEAGAVCAPDGRRYQHPGHARVKVSCEEGTIRLDPTRWTTTSLKAIELSPELLTNLQDELVNADAATAFSVGRKARGLFLVESDDNRENVAAVDPTEHVDRDGFAPQYGHRLKDDFNPSSKANLYRLLAANEQEELVAEVWKDYYRFREQVGDSTIVCDRDACVLLNGKTAALLEKEVELVGIAQSKLCSLIPQMVQDICSTRENDFWGTVAKFMSDDIQDLHVRAAVMTHFLHPTTSGACIYALSHNPELLPSNESANFLERVFALLSSDEFNWGYSSDDGDLAAKLLALINTFSDEHRMTLAQGLAGWLAQGDARPEEILLREPWGCSSLLMLSPFTVQRDALHAIFPTLDHAPLKEARMLLLSHIDSKDTEFKDRDLDDNLVVAFVISRYFDSRHYPQLKPIITEHIASLLKKFDARCVDFTSSTAVSTLCDLVYLDDKATTLEGQAFVRAADFYSKSMDVWGDRKEEDEPKREFFRGYILKQLHTAGLLDISQIAEYLYSPTIELIQDAFHLLWLRDPFLDDSDLGNPELARKRREIYLAKWHEWSKRGANVRQADVIRDVVTRNLVDPGISELVSLALRDRDYQREGGQSARHAPHIVECLIYLLSVDDVLGLRSIMRQHAIFEQLGKHFSDSRNAALAESEDGRMSPSRNKNRDLSRYFLESQPAAELLYDGDARFFLLEFSISELSKTRKSLAKQRAPDSPSERARLSLVSLLN